MLNALCPQCGRKDFIPVAYGTPDEAMIERIEAGTLLHGGCAISGLMQTHYCPHCDVRYDMQCTPEFLDGIQTLSYSDAHTHFVVHFDSHQLRIVQNNDIQQFPYTQELQASFSNTQIEFWQSTDDQAWCIHINSPQYFRDVIELSGSAESPSAFTKLLDWFKHLNIKIH
jgi:hypothetical protein